MLAVAAEAAEKSRCKYRGQAAFAGAADAHSLRFCSSASSFLPTRAAPVASPPFVRSVRTMGSTFLTRLPPLLRPPSRFWLFFGVISRSYWPVLWGWIPEHLIAQHGGDAPACIAHVAWLPVCECYHCLPSFLEVSSKKRKYHFSEG